MLLVYANDVNIEMLGGFSLINCKSAFTVQLFGYIWKVILNKAIGESLCTNDLDSYVQ